MTKNDLEEWVELSRAIGDRPDYVQGGGGNTSIKLDSARMAIKASGSLLKEMKVNSGFSVVGFQDIRSYLEAPDSEEDVFNKKIKSFVLDTEFRPSIETGFHAILGKVVVHTHSIFSNILNCAERGEELVRNIFPEAVWVSYASPGRDLTLRVRSELEKAESQAKEELVVFIQNHGLIVSASTSEAAWNLHESVNTKIIDYFKIRSLSFEDYLGIDKGISSQEILFPDQVVYTLVEDEAITKSQAAIETLAAYHFIRAALKHLKLQPLFLESSEVEKLQNMESEKFRQKVLKK